MMIGSLAVVSFRFAGWAGAAAQLVGPNLLSNPGFEQGETGWGFHQNYGESQRGITTDEKHSGRQCVFISNQAEQPAADYWPKGPPTNLDAMYISEPIKIDPSKQYCASVWVKADIPPEEYITGLSLYLNPFTADGKRPLIVTYPLMGGEGNLGGSLGWVKYEYDGLRFQREATTITFTIRLHYTGTIWIDDVSLRESQTPLPQTDLNQLNLPTKHPYVLITRERVDWLQELAERGEWPKPLIAGAKRWADDACQKPLKLPDPPAKMDHRDPVIGVVDWIGLAYVFTADEKYAEKAREILLACASKYPLYKGRATGGSMDEATWATGLAWAYDCIYESPCLSPQDRKHIENDLLRLAAQRIMPVIHNLSNRQALFDQAVVAIGICLKDREMLEWAINGPYGFHRLLQDEVLDEGMWREGSTGYHQGTQYHLTQIAAMCRGVGLNLFQDEKMKKMYLLLPKLRYPDWRIPALADAHEMDLLGTGNQWPSELGYAEYGDPTFAWMAAESYRRHKPYQFYLLRFKDTTTKELDEVPEPTIGSTHLPDSGITILRDGAGDDAQYLLLRYGPHPGGHAHFDALNIILYANGKELAPDPGSGPRGYVGEEHWFWYKNTLGHNTIMVDQHRQRPARGHAEFFADFPGLKVACASGDEIWPGVNLRRTVALTDSYAIDFFQAVSEQPHTYDWLLHNIGSLTTALPVKTREAKLGDLKGYSYIQDVKSATINQTWMADWKTDDDQGLMLTMLGSSGTEVITGNGPGPKADQALPLVIVRRRSKSTAYASILEPYQGKPQVSKVERLPGSDSETIGMVVQRGDISDYFATSSALSLHSLGDLRFDGSFAAGLLGGKELVALYLVGGRLVALKGWKIETDSICQAALEKADKGYIFRVQSDKPVQVNISGLFPARVSVSTEKGDLVPSSLTKGRLSFRARPGETYLLIAK